MSGAAFHKSRPDDTSHPGLGVLHIQAGALIRVLGDLLRTSVQGIQLAGVCLLHIP